MFNGKGSFRHCQTRSQKNTSPPNFMATHDQQEMTYIQPQQVTLAYIIYMHGPDIAYIQQCN